MSDKNLSHAAMKICMDDTIQKVLDIFEADDEKLLNYIPKNEKNGMRFMAKDYAYIGEIDNEFKK